jgi:hypothetical protein
VAYDTSGTDKKSDMRLNVDQWLTERRDRIRSVAESEAEIELKL